jgi:hypothetical protein
MHKVGTGQREQHGGPGYQITDRCKHREINKEKKPKGATIVQRRNLSLSCACKVLSDVVREVSGRRRHRLSSGSPYVTRICDRELVSRIRYVSIHICV